MSYLKLAAIQTGRLLFRGIPLTMTFSKNKNCKEMFLSLFRICCI